MIQLDKKTIYMASVALFVVLSGVIYLSFFASVAGDNPDTVVITLPVEEAPGPSVEEWITANLTERPMLGIVDDGTGQPASIPPTTPAPSEVVVFVSGEVYAPGVFTLPHGARKIDAVELAGGFTGYADLNRINLADLLVDGQHVILPAIGQVVTEPDQLETQTATPVDTDLVNINTATATQLQTLPGIGPVLSENIINHRQTHGAFATVDELQNVHQIGAITVNNLRGLVSVD